MIDIIALIIGLGLLALMVTLGIRNEIVYQGRMKILRELSSAAQNDIDQGKAWQWRYDQFGQGPSYQEMVWKFWKPVRSFYEGAPYLR